MILIALGKINRGEKLFLLVKAMFRSYLIGKLHLDMLEERREQAAAIAEARRQQVARYYNKRVQLGTFKVGDLVLRKVEIGKGNVGTGKLEPNREGPYQVIEATDKGAYKLRGSKGNTIPRYWNVESLRKYYQ